MASSAMASPPDEVDIKQLSPTTQSINAPEKPVGSTPTKSPGVLRIEALNAHTSLVNRCFIFFGLFLVAYAYGLDGSLRGVYQPHATADFKSHSTLATINVLRSVIAAAAQVCVSSRVMSVVDQN